MGVEKAGRVRFEILLQLLGALAFALLVAVSQILRRDPGRMGLAMDGVGAVKKQHRDEGMTMAEMAMRFILGNPTVSTIIPGMRKLPHVHANIATSDAGPLDESLMAELKSHRWDRTPTEWSQ